MSDYRLIALVLVGLTTAVLAFVMRSESSRQELHLPEGVALAEPARRLAASVIDLLFAALIASKIIGTPMLEVFSAAGLLGGGALRLLVAAVVVAIIIGTFSEWFFARTLGKWLLGCGVISTAPGAGETKSAEEEGALPGLRFSQSVIRNFVKWTLLPFGVVIFVDPNGIHPGDRLARSVVVIPIPEEEEDEDFEE
jgi:hypothetical protein